MSTVEYLIALQMNGGQGGSINSDSAEILVIVLFAVIFGLMALVFIRTGSNRSHKH